MAKFLKNNSGGLAEEVTVGTSAGAGDAGKVVHLNGSGVLDSTIVNSKNTSAGAGDAGKIPALNASGVLDSTIVNSKTTSAGAGDSGKLVALDSSGKIDTTMMPVGIGADSLTVTTTEVIAAGAFVNLHNSSGTKARNADASNGREAHAFTITGGGNGASIVVYFEGSNTAVSSKTPGATQYLSGSSPGASTESAPTTSGHVVQRLGVATSATSINFEPQPPITLA